MDLKLIKKEKTGYLYNYGDDKILKLFHEEVSEDEMQNEYKAVKLANKIEYLSPRAHEMITLGAQSGIVFEDVESLSLKQYFLKHISRVRFISKIFSGLHIKLHSLESDELINQVTYFEKELHKITVLSEEIKEVLIDYMKTLPRESRLCHGHFDLSQIMIDKTWQVTNFSYAYQGNPCSDVQKTHLLLLSPNRNKDITFIQRCLLATCSKWFNRMYLQYYLRQTSYSKKQVKAWKVIVAAIQLNEMIQCEKSWLLSIVFSEMKRLKL
ncbi:MAG: hypothetical protein JEZ08_09355 [Clostridiales bacterium]|nr:hypothetical protein [Clostridiales bacterium]